MVEKRLKPWIFAVVISYQLNNNPTRTRSLFAKTTGDLPRCLIVLLFSVALMVVDTRYSHLTVARSFLSFGLSPLRTLSMLPARLLQDSRALWTSKQALVRENQALAYQHLLLREELQHAEILRQENQRLKSLLKLSEVTGRKTMAARVLSAEVNPVRHVMILDKGSNDHVLIGQPVLSQHGLVGQIIEVTQNASTVLLISDGLSAVPVKNNRTGEMGILAGNDNDHELTLLHLPKTSSVMVNDLLVTSGLGGLYPEGYPVGRVSQILNKPGEHFIEVRVSPMALLRQSHLVLLVWPKTHRSLMSRSCYWPGKCVGVQG